MDGIEDDGESLNQDGRNQIPPDLPETLDIRASPPEESIPQQQAHPGQELSSGYGTGRAEESPSESSFGSEVMLPLSVPESTEGNPESSEKNGAVATNLTLSNIALEVKPQEQFPAFLRVSITYEGKAKSHISMRESIEQELGEESEDPTPVENVQGQASGTDPSGQHGQGSQNVNQTSDRSMRARGASRRTAKYPGKRYTSVNHKLPVEVSGGLMISDINTSPTPRNMINFFPEDWDRNPGSDRESDTAESLETDEGSDDMVDDRESIRRPKKRRKYC